MKKWLLLCMTVATLVLGACSDSKEQATTEVNPSANEEKGNKEEQLKQTHYNQFQNVLAEAVDTLGFANESGDYVEDEYQTGVFYAELVDFNNDGFEELYVLLKNNGYGTSDYAHRNVTNYVHEIWSGNESGDEPRLAYSFEIPAMQCSACDLSVSLVDMPDGQTVLKQSSYHMSMGESSENNTYYSMDANANFTEKVFEILDFNFTIDGETVEEAAYMEQIENYADDRPIIISGAGMKSYGFEGKGTAPVVSVLTTLAANANDLSDKKNVDEATKKTVSAGFDNHANTKRLDVYNPDSYVNMVFNVLMYSNLPSTSDESFNSVFAEEDVLEAIKERYGVKLKTSDREFLSALQPSDSIVWYENGQFYMKATDFYLDDINRSIDAVYEVSANDVYYVELTDHEFDSMSYYTNTDDQTDLFTIDFSQWPEESLRSLRANIKRYAVVKMIDGTPIVQYIGLQNLTNEQLATY